MQFLVCLLESLKLGLSSFGGPVAHLAYFREAYVERLQWLTDERFAELLAVCQFMPGPASSQLGASIGYEKGGWLGAFGSWLGFTAPSAILMILFVTSMDTLNGLLGSGWVHGLTIVAVAVVANAVIGMQRQLCADVKGKLIAFVVAAILIVFQVSWLQPLLILLGGFLGVILFKVEVADTDEGVIKHPWFSIGILGCFVLGVVILSSVRFSNDEATMVGGLAKTGSMVFGGGHVVLPLLEAETVGKNLLGQEDFLAGYGLAQAVPGPMFTFSAYIGAFVGMAGSSWLGGVVGVGAIFLPGMILLMIGMPIWNAYKKIANIRAALKGASAAVVGLIFAALFSMLRLGVISNVLEVVLAVVFGVILYKKYLPVWMVVLVGASLGVGMDML